MPKSKPISPEELAAIRESVAKAEGDLWLELTCAKDFWKVVRKEAKLTPEHRLQERMLLSLKFMQNLRQEPIPEVIAKAVIANDVRFFIRLGKTLSSRPKRAEDYPVEKGETPKPDNAVRFLLSHWAKPKDGLPELFYLTPQDLAEVCNYCLGVKYHTADALVKLRQRLGLLPFKRRKIRVIVEDGKLKFP